MSKMYVGGGIFIEIDITRRLDGAASCWVFLVMLIWGKCL